MFQEERYFLGQRFRQLLLIGKDQFQEDDDSAPRLRVGPYGAKRAPDQSAGVVGQFNRAARLKPGHLLAVYLGRRLRTKRGTLPRLCTTEILLRTPFMLPPSATGGTNWGISARISA